MANKRKIYTCDCETDPFLFGRVPEPFIWGVYTGSKFLHFDSTNDFICWAVNQDVDFYAHNGGKFDFHFFLDKLQPTKNLKIINGRLAKFTLGLANFIDSYLIAPVPLKEIQKDDFDYTWLERDFRAENMEKIISYLRGDCVYLWNYLNHFFEIYGKSLTIAGAAMKQWKEFAPYIPKTNEKFFYQFQPYYYGGRVQPFKNGIFRGNFKYIDINSAYPFAMLSNHPYGTRFYETKRVLDRDLKKSFVHCKCNSQGALPVRVKGGGIQYPHGPGEFFVTGWEIIAGIKTGTITNFEPIKYIVFEETENFSDYINHFYELKKQSKAIGDNTTYLISKLFMNSLYGKFASNFDKYDEFALSEYGEKPEDYTTETLIAQTEHIDEPEERVKRINALKWHLDGNIYDKELWARKLLDHKKYWYNVATAASITGYVRAFLWESICQCKGVIYCDTDSIMCENIGSLALGDELGQWSVDAEPIQIAIGGKKLYATWNDDGSTKKACKGVRLNPGQIFQVAKGREVVYENPVPTFSLTNGITFQKRRISKTV